MLLIRKFVSPICDGVLGIKPHAAVRVRWSATKFKIKETSVAEIVHKLEISNFFLSCDNFLISYYTNTLDMYYFTNNLLLHYKKGFPGVRCHPQNCSATVHFVLICGAHVESLQ